MEFCYLVPDKSQKIHGGVYFAQCKGFRNPEKFCLRNPEPWALESAVQLKESEILQRNGIQNPSCTDKDWNLESTAWNPESKTVLDSLIWGDLFHPDTQELKDSIIKSGSGRFIHVAHCII